MAEAQNAATMNAIYNAVGFWVQTYTNAPKKNSPFNRLLDTF